MDEVKDIADSETTFTAQFESYIKSVCDGNLMMPKSVAIRLLVLLSPALTTQASMEITQFVTGINSEGYVSCDQVVDYFRRKPGVDWAELSRALAVESKRAKSNLTLNLMAEAKSDVTSETTTDNADSGARLQHIVLFTFRPDATETELSQVAKHVFRFTFIPGVIDVKFGPVKTALYPEMQDRSNGFNHVLHVVVKGAAALQAYNSHPIHEDVRDTVLRPMSIRPAVAVDYFSAF